MIEPFLLRAALAGAAVALVAGPLGSFVTWRRMAYFGDATSHAAVLGVALSLVLALPVWLGVLAMALACGASAAWMVARGQAMDSALGVLAHAALALGLVGVSLVPGVRVDLTAYLFGDILAVTWQDLAVIWIGALAVAALLVWRWGRLLLATLSEDLALTAGVVPARERIILTLALAVTVAVALKVVGALLIAAMLVIPPAAARAFSRSPEVMALGAAGLGLISVVLGLGLSLGLDTPAGPSVVVAAAFLFALSLPFKH